MALYGGLVKNLSRRALRSAKVLGAGALLAGAWSAEAIAASDKAPAPRAPELQAIVDCRAMTDRDARLNCYDAAAAKFDQAVTTGQVVVVNREQARQVRRDVFGLQLPSLDIFGRKGVAATGEDVDQLRAKVKSASQRPDGRWVVELDTGAVWRQVDDSNVGERPQPGAEVEIRRASLGSFFLRIAGRPGFRAHRDQ